jgi:hypothetical protein
MPFKGDQEESCGRTHLLSIKYSTTHVFTQKKAPGSSPGMLKSAGYNSKLLLGDKPPGIPAQTAGSREL